MMDRFEMTLSPSEAFQRLTELKTQAEYEKLTTDELSELEMLKEICQDTFGDFQEDYY